MSATLWPVLHDLAERAAKRWDFPVPKLKPALPRWRSTYDGMTRRVPCEITLRVTRYRRPGQPLAKSTIFASLAHELAHLAAWHVREPDHGPRWRETTLEIAEWMRAEGHTVSTNLYHGTFPYRYLPRHNKDRRKKRRKK